MAERNARRELERLADEVVPLLIAQLARSDLGELEVRDGAWRVRVRRGAPGEEPAVAIGTSESAGGRAGRRRRTAQRGTGGPSASRGSVEPAPDVAARGSRGATGKLGTPSANGENPPLEPVGPGRHVSHGADGSPGVQADARRMLVRAPAVGYFIPVDALATGERVEVDDLVGQIDVLGVRQDVYSAGSGIVSRLLVEPGQAVEYGQELIQVDLVPRAQASAAARDDAPVPD